MCWGQQRRCLLPGQSDNELRLHQPLEQRLVGGEQLLPELIGQRDVQHVVDRVVVMAAGKVPRPIQGCGIVAKRNRQPAQVRVGAVSGKPFHRPRRQPVTSALDTSSIRIRGASNDVSDAAQRASSRTAGPSGSASGATQSTTMLASTTGIATPLAPVVDDQVGGGHPGATSACRGDLRRPRAERTKGVV